MFEQISAPEIVKWILLVFLAGFIGFFGKFLGKLVIALFQRKKDAADRTSPLPDQAVNPGAEDGQEKVETVTPPVKEMTREEQKLLKKALKNEVKAKKKGEKR